MQNTIVHNEGATSLEGAVGKVKPSGSLIKLGLDIHAKQYVVVTQYDQLLPKVARRFWPGEFVPWVESLLRQGHTVYVVYEACGFGFGLYRELCAAGAHCYVIAPRKLDEQRTGVKTDPRDATTLCQRLSRYVEGNTGELAVIRVPSQAEEQARHVTRQREQLVHHRQKLEAQGRSLLMSHALPAPAHWWKKQTWSRFNKLLPHWIIVRLEVYQPVLLALEEQIAALTCELEAAAPPNIPAGLGKLTTVMLTREICNWNRFNNRRAISSYTGLCPGERSSGSKRVPGSVTKRGNPRLRAALVECAWRMVRFQPQYPPVKKRLAVLAKGAKATGAQRKKAIVAVARHLAVDLWRVHTRRLTPEQLGFNNSVRGEQL
jgi:transposase